MTEKVRRPRTGLRGMLVAVAVAAVLSAVALNWLPAVRRRRHAEAVLAQQYRALVDPGAAPIQSFGRLGEKRPSDLSALRASRRDVARRLLQMVETPGDPGGGLPLEWRPSPHLPGVWAADRLGEWVVEADDFELGREVTAGLFDLAAGGRLLPEVESASLAVLLLESAPRLGLDPGRRALAMARVRSLAAVGGPKGGRLGLWARLAAEAGTRDDLLAILDLAARDRELARVVATSSAFADCRWPGLVGPVYRLAAHSDDPRALLDFAAFLATRAGREALLAFAADESHPLPERRGAIHRLKREPVGVAFLLDACGDPARRSTVVEFFGRDHAGLPGDPPPYAPRPTLPYARDAADPSDPRPELRRLLGDLGRMDDPWPRLRRELDREARRVESLAAGLPPDEAERRAMDRSEHTLDLLLVAAPGRDPMRDAPIAWKDWFAALERFPDGRDGRDRLGADFRLATLPPDTVDVLVRIARAPTSPHREAALRLLVAKTERVEEVGPLIDSLAEKAGRDPDRLSSRDPESLRALRRRFAIDHGWDVAAWRDWWARESGSPR